MNKPQTSLVTPLWSRWSKMCFWWWSWNQIQPISLPLNHSQKPSLLVSLIIQNIRKVCMSCLRAMATSGSVCTPLSGKLSAGWTLPTSDHQTRVLKLPCVKSGHQEKNYLTPLHTVQWHEMSWDASSSEGRQSCLNYGCSCEITTTHCLHTDFLSLVGNWNSIAHAVSALAECSAPD